MSLRSTEPISQAEQAAIESAEAAGLHYVHDRDAGYSRKRSGKKAFSYFDPRGKKVSDKKLLERFAALKIPPAWEGVWICTRANGHLQCTGRDARGRKQYLYHADWRQFRDQTKYTKMISFGEKLPAIRRKVKRDLSLSGLPREKVLASIVAIMDEAHIRVGNDEYAKTNDSYGLTTLRHRHVKVTSEVRRESFTTSASTTHESRRLFASAMI
jgi:DNA topoisomerase-1